MKFRQRAVSIYALLMLAFSQLATPAYADGMGIALAKGYLSVIGITLVILIVLIMLLGALFSSKNIDIEKSECGSKIYSIFDDEFSDLIKEHEYKIKTGNVAENSSNNYYIGFDPLLCRYYIYMSKVIDSGKPKNIEYFLTIDLMRDSLLNQTRLKPKQILVGLSKCE